MCLIGWRVCLSNLDQSLSKIKQNQYNQHSIDNRSLSLHRNTNDLLPRWSRNVDVLKWALQLSRGVNMHYQGARQISNNTKHLSNVIKCLKTIHKYLEKNHKTARLPLQILSWVWLSPKSETLKHSSWDNVTWPRTFNKYWTKIYFETLSNV